MREWAVQMGYPNQAVITAASSSPAAKDGGVVTTLRFALQGIQFVGHYGQGLAHGDAVRRRSAFSRDHLPRKPWKGPSRSGAEGATRSGTLLVTRGPSNTPTPTPTGSGQARSSVFLAPGSAGPRVVRPMPAALDDTGSAIADASAAGWSAPVRKIRDCPRVGHQLNLRPVSFHTRSTERHQKGSATVNTRHSI